MQLGMNIHIGGKSTAVHGLVTGVVSACKENGIYFIDSRTNSKSLCNEIANNLKVPFLNTNIFLEHEEKSVAHVKKQLKKAGEIAKKRGHAVVIGHVGPEGGMTTVNGINQMKEYFEKEGIELVYVSELLNINSTKNVSTNVEPEEKTYIKWVDFNITYTVLEKAMNIDIKSHTTGEVKHNWIELLAYLGAKYGGDFSRYKSKDMDDLVKKLEEGQTIEELTQNMKYYNYYFEAYTAILDEFVGNYSIQVSDKDGNTVWQDRYGLKAFFPLALGYHYGDYDDFGNGRDYGYKRKHLGHDFMASIGTPVIAIESGVIEELGWNQYGGWRIGIRSFDKKRYYYYAHLRKDYPYVKTLKQGDTVKAGDVIGYVGRTGYSAKENTNNIDQNHLHLGMQLIFDESQKEGVNEIWIDLYAISRLLEKNKSQVQKIEGSKEYRRIYDISID